MSWVQISPVECILLLCINHYVFPFPMSILCWTISNYILLKLKRMSVACPLSTELVILSDQEIKLVQLHLFLMNWCCLPICFSHLSVFVLLIAIDMCKSTWEQTSNHYFNSSSINKTAIRFKWIIYCIYLNHSCH